MRIPGPDHRARVTSLLGEEAPIGSIQMPVDAEALERHRGSRCTLKPWDCTRDNPAWLSATDSQPKEPILLVTAGQVTGVPLRAVSGSSIGLPELVAVCAPDWQELLPRPLDTSLPLPDLSVYDKYNPGERLSVQTEDGQTMYGIAALTHNFCSSRSRRTSP